MDGGFIQADIVGRLLVIQEALDVMPGVKGMAEFLERALLEVPGLDVSYICHRGRLFLGLNVELPCCSGSGQWREDVRGEHECAIENIQGMKVMPLRTINALHGYLVLDVGDPEQLAPYEPFLKNICNVLSRTIENRETMQSLREANLALQKTRDVLEESVLQRTEQLRESEERYRGMFYDSSAVMLLIEAETLHIVDANDAACRFYGYDRETLSTMTIQNINMLPLEKIYNIIQRLKTHQTEHFFMRHKLASGKIRDVEVYAGPVMIKGKMYICSVIHDITERVRAQEHLHLFRYLMDQTNDAIFIIDPLTARLLDANDKACISLDYTKEELLNLSVLDVDAVVTGEAAWREYVTQLKSATALVFESKHRRRDASLFDVEINVKYVYSEISNYMVAVVRDISERKRYENSLLQTTQQLEELNRTLKDRVAEEVEKNRLKDLIMYDQARHTALGELLVNIAHHWRQPLCTIGLMVQDIKDAYSYNELNEQYIDDSVKAMMKEILELSDTIDNFKSFYVHNKDMTRFNLSDTVNKAISIIKDYFRGKNTTIYTDMDKRITLYGYPDEFSQALLNILSNTKDAFEARNVLNGLIKIEAHQNPQSGTISLIITDNGGGISDDIIGKIFDPYFTTKDKARGTGLGLYSAKVIVEKKMKGSITVSNTSDGCQFRIELQAALTVSF
ncbi:MAG: PAS domain-containing sensor histidine kinase [Magnetococcales bacterium]|uniref:histidine kinase n=1 Tax=Candidatus Magnetobacterium casense TaxID=1455061 RepID=A0ABS6RYE1_9BACT|nr:PAS domain-containing sensor histidine kinase [Candidatus Magnetobacterium casensis]MBF0608277.1 PAS domain-containing sensor histidine kinase [Nitrospirota bacterium]MBV6341243.1 PAS domain-containing sensor histidine kinase [Candidatus Magnetobacterium casensis]